MNILLIEDSKGDILLIDSAFGELGISYSLTVKENGMKALSYIDEADLGNTELPDFIILDLNLPYISGFDLLQQIRQSGRLKDTPVIVFSSSAEEKDKLRALELGAAAYFTKPVDYNAYIATVESFLGIVNI
ncbi:MAG TPA: response regulator [Ignavibacteriales bacterium]|nr:response regulator [Ignavibacteriales bacterium]